MGPNGNLPAYLKQEVNSQSNLGGDITAGGGFSRFYATPSWQSYARDKYFATIASGTSPTAGYNRYGRGYPDVAMLGMRFNVFTSQQLTTLSGTSASAPLFAAMVSLVNAARLSKGLTSLGFLNPTLYSNSSQV
jgi:tripeptidyl-peptidase-1